MKIELDMHTHTLASGHAFSTLQEMARAGADKGLKLLGITENTQGMIRVIRHPYIQIISHPCDGTAQLDFEPIVLAAKECRTLLEINNSSLKPTRNKVDARTNNLTLLRLCKQHEVPVILGSDAHISFDIANYQYLYDLLQETEFPEALIVNRSVELFKNHLKKI